MSDNNKGRKKANLTLLAYIALFLGAAGLILSFFGLDFMGSIVQFLMFTIAAIVAFDITKDGKEFFKSFYKISYVAALVVIAIFIIIPFVKNLIALFQ